MRKQRFFKFVLLIFLFGVTLLFAIPGGPDLKVGKWHKPLKLHKGLDLVGGTQLVYQLDTANYQAGNQVALERAIEIIRLRIDALGVAEPIIQTTTLGGKPAIIVELPGINDTSTARDTIGQTAQLSFLTTDGNVVLTGAEVKQASIIYNQITGMPQVQLELNDKGKEAFAQATAANIGKPIFILLDRTIVSNPVVQEAIPNGVASITVGGNDSAAIFTQVKQLTTQINSGALPVPLELVQERTVGASLGGFTVAKSIFAGLIGFAIIMIFMSTIYGLAGLIAAFTLMIYGFIMLILIQFIPITLTLAGIAGLILTLGITIDANVLIFERIREERREEIDSARAISDGYKRAWNSIRDANISSIITAIILFQLGTGPIKGFALILILGIVVGLFTAVTCTRIIINFFILTKIKDRLIS